MQLGRLTSLTSAFAGAALGVAIGVTATAGGATQATLDAATAPAAAHAIAATTPPYVVYDCSHHGVVKPSTEVLTCADAGAVLESLHWTTWAPQLAAAYGIFRENDCQPNCADGHFHNYSVIVTAWGSASVTGHPGERRYTEFTLTFPGTSRPPVYEVVNHKLVATYPVTQVFSAI